MGPLLRINTPSDSLMGATWSSCPRWSGSLEPGQRFASVSLGVERAWKRRGIWFLIQASTVLNPGYSHQRSRTCWTSGTRWWHHLLITCRLSSPFLHHSPLPKIFSHKFVAGRSFQVLSKQFWQQAGNAGRGCPSYLESNHQQQFRRGGPFYAPACRWAVFVRQSPAHASTREWLQAAGVRHWLCWAGRVDSMVAGLLPLNRALVALPLGASARTVLNSVMNSC